MAGMLTFTVPTGGGDATLTKPKPMSIADFAALPAKIINDLVDYLDNGRLETYHDTLIVVAGTAFTVDQALDVASSGIGAVGYTWNTQATYIKTEWHTNFTGNQGKFPFNSDAIVIGLELVAIPYPSKANVVGSGSTIGMVTDTADNASQPAAYNPVQYLRAMLFQSTWQWQWDKATRDEGGLFLDIPSTVGMVGFGGTANQTVVQSVAPRGRGLKKAKTILANNDDFFVRVKPKAALLNPVDFPMFMRFLTVRTGGAHEAVE